MRWLVRDETPKYHPKSKLQLEKIMVAICRVFLASLSHQTPIDIMHQELAHSSLVNRKYLIIIDENRTPYISKQILQKLDQLGYKTLPDPAYSPGN